MFVVVIMNPQGGIFENESGWKPECNVLIAVTTAGKGKTEWGGGFDGLQTGTFELEHVGFEGAHERGCGKALDVEPDYELVVFG
jgi:hypothetical protein